MQATIKIFVDHCARSNLHLPVSGFEIQSNTDIPFQVGFAGSSAIIIAVLRALMQHCAVTIDKPALATLALSVETAVIGAELIADEAVQHQRRGIGKLDAIDSFSTGLISVLSAV